MAPTFVDSMQPVVNDHKSQIFSDNPGAHGQHIGVIVLPGEECRVSIGAADTAYTFYFIGCNRNTDAGSAAENPLVAFTICNGRCSLVGIFRIIAADGVIGSEVFICKSQFF